MCKTDCSGAEILSYNTKQSKMVFDILLENKDRHLTADEIFFLAKLQMPTIAMATVYNNLNAMCDAGRASVKQRFTAILKSCAPLARYENSRAATATARAINTPAKTPNAASTTTSNAPNAASSYTPNANF